jgi:hypothetical protein
VAQPHPLLGTLSEAWRSHNEVKGLSQMSGSSVSAIRAVPLLAVEAGFDRLVVDERSGEFAGDAIDLQPEIQGAILPPPQ